MSASAQFSLFSPAAGPVPSRRESRTSRQAASRIHRRGLFGPRVRAILAVLAVKDCTDSEIQRATGLARHSICSARGACVKRGLVTASGLEREGSVPGFQQTVWKITTAGRMAALRKENG